MWPCTHRSALRSVGRRYQVARVLPDYRLHRRRHVGDDHGLAVKRFVQVFAEPGFVQRVIAGGVGSAHGGCAGVVAKQAEVGPHGRAQKTHRTVDIFAAVEEVDVFRQCAGGQYVVQGVVEVAAIGLVVAVHVQDRHAGEAVRGLRHRLGPGVDVAGENDDVGAADARVYRGRLFAPQLVVQVGQKKDAHDWYSNGPVRMSGGPPGACPGKAA